MNFIKERIASDIVQKVGYKLENDIKVLLKFKNFKSRDEVGVLYLLKFTKLFCNIKF